MHRAQSSEQHSGAGHLSQQPAYTLNGGQRDREIALFTWHVPLKQSALGQRSLSACF